MSAEAFALREATTIDDSFGLSKVIFESDNLALTKACGEEIKVGEIHSLILDIQELKRRFQWCGFTWVSRDGKRVAHQIAQHQMQGVLPLYWRWRQPESLQSLILRDKQFRSRGLGGASDTAS